MGVCYIVFIGNHFPVIMLAFNVCAEKCCKSVTEKNVTDFCGRLRKRKCPNQTTKAAKHALKRLYVTYKMWYRLGMNLVFIVTDSIVNAIAASEVDLEAGDHWGKEASAASFFFPMVPGLQIDLRGRNRIYNTISNNWRFLCLIMPDFWGLFDCILRRQPPWNFVFVEVWSHRYITDWITLFGGPKDNPPFSSLLSSLIYSVFLPVCHRFDAFFIDYICVAGLSRQASHEAERSYSLSGL